MHCFGLSFFPPHQAVESKESKVAVEDSADLGKLCYSSFLFPCLYFDRPFAADMDADVRVDASSNVILMLKLSVFQSDQETVQKLTALALLDETAREQPVHLLVSSDAVYLLTPLPSGEYKTLSNLSFPQLQV